MQTKTKTWGGRRENAGAKKNPNKAKRVLILIKKETKEKLDYESKRTSLPRGKIIDGLVENLKTNALASP